MTESVAQLEQSARDEGFSFDMLTPKQRFSLVRRTKYMIFDEIHKGNRDTASIEEIVTGRLRSDPAVGSLVTIIAIAVLSGFIQWLIKRILDRWYPEVDDA